MDENKLVATNHSMIFALISKHILKEFGKDGEAAIIDGVKRYGNERGKRMALRAKIDGQTLDVKSYLAYGEWEANTGETDWRYTNFSPEFTMENHACPWHYAWEKYDLNNFGKLYCTVVDAALAEGFGNLDLRVLKTLSLGDDFCEFIFVNNGLSEDDRKELDKLKQKLGTKAKMSWGYHIGHLYYTMSEVINDKLGDKGIVQMEKALDEYANLFGPNSKEAVLKFRDTNFNIVEDYSGI